jgi:hypothetical protein
MRLVKYYFNEKILKKKTSHRKSKKRKREKECVCVREKKKSRGRKRVNKYF